MTPLPTQRDDNEESDGTAAVWAFLLTLFFFKFATVVLIFWHMRTLQAGLILGATFWYFLPPLIVLGAGPAIFYYRLRKVRARRDALRRSEWMELEPQDLGVPMHRRH
jgi:hypothetical protein